MTKKHTSASRAQEKAKPYIRVPTEAVGDVRLNSNALRVYLVLLDYDPCRPSQATIARRSNLSESAVKRAIKKLAELNYIHVYHRPSDQGRKDIRHNGYTHEYVTTQDHKKWIRKVIPNGSTSDTYMGPLVTPTRVHQRHLLGSTSDLRLSLKNSLKNYESNSFEKQNGGEDAGEGGKNLDTIKSIVNNSLRKMPKD